jgi:hypothetical protein
MVLIRTFFKTLVGHDSIINYKIYKTVLTQSTTAVYNLVNALSLDPPSNTIVYPPNKPSLQAQALLSPEFGIKKRCGLTDEHMVTECRAATTYSEWSRKIDCMIAAEDDDLFRLCDREHPNVYTFCNRTLLFKEWNMYKEWCNKKKADEKIVAVMMCNYLRPQLDKIINTPNIFDSYGFCHGLFLFMWALYTETVKGCHDHLYDEYGFDHMFIFARNVYESQIKGWAHERDFQPPTRMNRILLRIRRKANHFELVWRQTHLDLESCSDAA